MSLLTLVQNVCAELSIDQPSSIIGNTDSTVLQLLRLAQREGDDLARCYDWSDLIVQRSFVAAAQTPQTEPPADWERFYENSRIWNMSRRWVLNGPVDAQTWQRMQVYSANPVPQIWRVIGGKLAIYPATAGETVSYEYITKNWITKADGTGIANWQADTDTAIISERLIELGVIWRWKRAKGFDYAEEQRIAMEARQSEIGSDRARMPFSLSLPMRGEIPDNFFPGVIVP